MIAEIGDLPTFIQNDVTAAAGAEVIFGAARILADFAYIFVGRHTECRLALHHRVYAGSRARWKDQWRRRPPASLTDLEERAQAAGLDSTVVWRSLDRWAPLVPVLPEWVDLCATGLAETIGDIASFVDIGAVVIEGRMPRATLESLRSSVMGKLLDGSSPDGPPTLLLGEIGPLAKAVGAASISLHSRFMLEQVGLAPVSHVADMTYETSHGDVSVKVGRWQL